jgi:hypothetical protein
MPKGGFPGPLSPDNNQGAAGGASMKRNKNILTADEKDFINSREVAEKHNIDIGQQLNFLDAGKLKAFERLPGKDQWVWAEMEPDKWEKITGKKTPAGWPYMDSAEYDGPEEGLEVPVECTAEYRQLSINEIGKLTPEKLTELYFLRSEIAVSDDSKQPAAKSSKEAALRELSAAIEYELANTPPEELPSEPEKLQEIIFSARNVNKIIRRKLQCSVPHAKRQLSKRGLLDPRLKSKGGRGKKVPK